MAWSLDLPAQLKQHWRVKIRDKERNGPPHVTVMRGVEMWRVNLRSREFLVPPGGGWDDLPVELRRAIETNWQEM